MVSRRLLTRVVSAALLPALLIGCSADSTETYETSPFCVFMSELNAKAATATSPEQGLQLLRSSLPELEQQQPSAPEAMQADIGIVLAASRAALDANDLSPLVTDEVAEAGARLSIQCALTVADPTQTDADVTGLRSVGSGPRDAGHHVGA